MDSQTTEAGRRQDTKSASHDVSWPDSSVNIKKKPRSSLGKEQSKLFLEKALFVPREEKIIIS